jgi:hypothetical protein
VKAENYSSKNVQRIFCIEIGQFNDSSGIYRDIHEVKAINFFILKKRYKTIALQFAEVSL